MRKMCRNIKMCNCRHEIAIWRINNPLYEKERINELQEALEEVQTDDNINQKEILDVFRKLQEAYKDENDYWQQKSANMWYPAGDSNTKFYLAFTKQRQSRNPIIRFHNKYGQWITYEMGYEKVKVDYLDEIFTSTCPLDFKYFLQEIPSTITNQMDS